MKETVATAQAGNSGAHWANKCLKASPADISSASSTIISYESRFAVSGICTSQSLRLFRIAQIAHKPARAHTHTHIACPFSLILACPPLCPSPPHRRSFQLHEKHLVKLDAAVVTVAKASRELNKAVRRCGVVAGAYAGDAGCNIDAAGKKDSFKDSVTKLGMAMTAWGRDAALQPAVLNEVLKTGVTYERQQVRAFNELLAMREAKLAELDKREKKLAGYKKLVAEGKTETAGGMMSKKLVREAQPKQIRVAPDRATAPLTVLTVSFSSQNLLDAVASAKASVAEVEEEVKVMTGALLEFEFKKFDNEMTEVTDTPLSCIIEGGLRALHVK